jgi:hypothetical protein
MKGARLLADVGHASGDSVGDVRDELVEQVRRETHGAGLRLRARGICEEAVKDASGSAGRGSAGRTCVHAT